ncbi:MAG: hypothetical protein C4521_01550, partial [Actinobacteria bacterium]
MTRRRTGLILAVLCGLILLVSLQVPGARAAPFGTISLEADATYTASRVVVLTSNVSDVTTMRIRGYWTGTAAGYYHTLGLRSDGTLWSWGRNQYGQVGDGTLTNRLSPVQVAPGTQWDAAAGGVNHTLGIQRDGTLWAWGRNGYAQLGDGTRTDRLVPVRIGTDGGWRAIDGGYGHSVGRKSDGTVWTWGYSKYGQLGDGTTIDKLSPARLGTGADWSHVEAGYHHTVALKNDGSLWTWGANAYGQLGDGTTVNRLSPVRIAAEETWTGVSAGAWHTLAIKSDGTLWAWGRNTDGQLGDGTIADRFSPVQIGTAKDWRGVTAGSGHSLATKSDGGLWAWGRNSNGQLGDGTTTQRTLPVQVTGYSPWSMMGAGENHSAGVHGVSGAVSAWGSGAYGQLGNGSSGDRSSPAEIDREASWGAWEPFVIDHLLTLPPNDGTKTVEAEYRNSAGETIVLADDIILDTRAPTGSVSINDGAASTSSTAVTLELVAADDRELALMRVSNDGVFDGPEEDWRPYQATLEWSLTAGEGTKTVSVQFKDGAGNESGVVSDDIVLLQQDETAPTGTMSVNSGAAYTTATAVSVDSSVAGAVRMRLREAGETWSGWVDYSAACPFTLSAGDGVRRVEAEYAAESGATLILSDEIVLDTTPPSGSILINSGEARTSTTSVMLTLAADDPLSGVSLMRVSDDGVFDTEDWEPFAAQRSFTLTEGEGTKTVWVSYMDGVGNVSVPVSDEIILDQTAPRVISRSPAPEEAGVSLETVVQIGADEALDADSVNGTSVRLTRTSDGAQVASALSLPAPDTIRLTPNSSLEAETSYTVTIAGVKDLAGNTVATESWEFATAASSGNTYYVSTSGSDSNSGSLSAPFGTIQKGVNVAEAGDTVYVRGGVYNEGVNIASKSGIRVARYQSEAPILRGPTGNGTAIFQISSGSNVIVDGFTIDEASVYSNIRGSLIAGMSINGSSNTIRNCTVKQSGSAGLKWGIHLYGTDNVVRDTTVDGINRSGTTSVGLYVGLSGSSRTTNPRIIGCTVGNCRNDSIYVGGTSSSGSWTSNLAATGGVVEGCTLYNPIIEDGIMFDQAYNQAYPFTDWTIRNNVIHTCGANAIDLKGVDGVTICGNELYHTNHNNTHSSGPSISRGAKTRAANVTIYNNYIHDNMGGIRVSDDNWKIYNNTIVHNNWDYAAWASGDPETAWDDPDKPYFYGIEFDNSRYGGGPLNGIEIYNNIIGGHRHGNIALRSSTAGTGCYIDYNFYFRYKDPSTGAYNGPRCCTSYLPPTYTAQPGDWQTYLEGISGVSGDDSRSLTGDPLFVAFDDVSGFDVHLQATSPCIDAGTATGAPATDKDGTSRDMPPDVGAYECTAADTSPPAGTMSVNSGAAYTSSTAVSVDSDVEGASLMRTR